MPSGRGPGSVASTSSELATICRSGPLVGVAAAVEGDGHRAMADALPMARPEGFRCEA